MSDLKDRCKAVMIAHLTTLGYPNMTRRQILNQLKPMWVALEDAGLVPEIKAAGETFHSFKEAALARAQDAAIEDFIQDQIDKVAGTKK